MKRSNLCRALLGLGILCYLLLMPARLQKGRGEEFYRANHLSSPPAYEGTFVLWHVVSQKTYQGSVTKLLQALAEEFSSAHYGLRIEVAGMGEEDFQERLSMVREPDLISFFTGALPQEQLRPMQWRELPVLRPGLAAGEYACPWFFSGYAYAASTLEYGEKPSSGAGGYAEAIPGAYYGFSGADKTREEFLAGKAQCALADLRAYGDLVRREAGPEWAAVPAGDFTDQVCYMGVFRRGREGSEACLARFMEFLLQKKSQRALSALGAFSVLQDGEQSFSLSFLEETNKAYAHVTTPDPFAYYSHKAALEEEAAAALQGDMQAEKRFFERLRVVIPG